MPADRRKQCYGTIFPPTLQGAHDRPIADKVFSYQLLTAGGTFRSGRRVAHDLSAWDDCLECPELDSCYKLSLGRLMLEAAIGEK